MQVFCEVCCCNIPSAALVPNHEKGRKHQLLLNKQIKKKQSLNCSVYITGFKKDSNVEYDLKIALEPYGTIKEVYVDKEKGKYAIVEYESEASVKNLLQEDDLNIHGHKLIIKPRNSKNPQSQQKLKQKPFHRENKPEFQSNVLTILKDNEPFVQQIIELVAALQLTEDDILLREKICELLQEVFREVYADCAIVPFGSTMNKLGCKGCDLDVTLITEDLGGYTHERGSNSKNIGALVVGNGSGVPSGVTEKDVNEVCQILRKYVPGCKNVFPLRSAHCPVISFFHKDSSLHCDLSINNRLAVQNSKLLQKYCEVDQRFRYLSYVVRCWATSKGIAGKGALQITKYAFTLMVVHFLQQCHPQILPCLQERTDADEEQCLIDGWNCYFNTKFKPNDDCDLSSTGQLLFGFFKYFAEYNWNEHILSISSVVLQTKEDFLAVLDVLGSRCAFKVGPVCIADPFELSHNVAQNLTGAGLENLKKKLDNAIQIMSVEEENIGRNWKKAPFNSSSDNDQRNQSTERPNFTKLDLKKLLQPIECKPPVGVQKRPKVKFTFDVYDEEGKLSRQVCQRCANLAERILTFDLKMQCKVKSVCDEQNVPCDLSTSTKTDKVEFFVEANEQASWSPRKPVTDAESKKEDDVVIEECIVVPNGMGKDTGEGKNGVNQLLVSQKRGLDSIGSEPPHKRQCKDGAAISAVQMPSDDAECRQTSECLTLEFEATAWVNTWVKRRKQRRLSKNSNSGSNDEVTNAVAGDIRNSSPSRLKATTACCSSDQITASENCSAKRGSSTQLPGDSLGTPEESKHSSQFPSNVIGKDFGGDGVKTSTPVIVSNVKFSASERTLSEPRCSVTVELKEAANLSDFHSFFAFFKKSILYEMKH